MRAVVCGTLCVCAHMYLFVGGKEKGGRGWEGKGEGGRREEEEGGRNGVRLCVFVLSKYMRPALLQEQVRTCVRLPREPSMFLNLRYRTIHNRK